MKTPAGEEWFVISSLICRWSAIYLFVVLFGRYTCQHLNILNNHHYLFYFIYVYMLLFYQDIIPYIFPDSKLQFCSLSRLTSHHFNLDLEMFLNLLQSCPKLEYLNLLVNSFITPFNDANSFSKLLYIFIYTQIVFICLIVFADTEYILGL